MGIFTKLNKSQIKKLLNSFPDTPETDFSYKGVGMGTVNTYYKLSFPGKKVFYLKIDEVGDEKRLKNEIHIFKNLHAEQGKLSYECPFPLKAKSHKYYIPFRRKFALVFPEVRGKAIFKGLTNRHLEVVGEKMAELHKIKVHKAIKHHRFNLKGLIKAYQSIEPKLSKKHPTINRFIHTMLKELKKIQPKSAKEVLIHADLFPENMHWQKGKFVGLIDFEAAGLGAPLFDICVGIHACCLNGIDLDKKKIKSFLKGYQKKRRLTQRDKKRFIQYMYLTCLRFLITRLKDFELPDADPKAENFKDYEEYVKRLIELKNFDEKFIFNKDL